MDIKAESGGRDLCGVRALVLSGEQFSFSGVHPSVGSGVNIDAPLLSTMCEAGLAIVRLLSETRLRQRGTRGRVGPPGSSALLGSSRLFTLE